MGRVSLRAVTIDGVDERTFEQQPPKMRPTVLNVAVVTSAMLPL